MMRKHITRTLTRSTVTAYAVKKVDGRPEVENLEPVTVWGTPNEKEALKAVREAHGANAIVGEVTITEETYRIKIDDFVALAELVGEQTSMDELEETDN